MIRLCLPAWRSLVWVGLAVATIFAAPAARAEWAPFAYVSATMGVSDSRICIGEASRGEIGCPSYSPTVSPTGTLNLTGGLVTNAVSLTTAGTNWGYLTSAASYLPNLTTGAISTTNISVSTINGLGISTFGGAASYMQKAMSTDWATAVGTVPLNTVTTSFGSRISSNGNQVTVAAGSAYLLQAALRAYGSSTYALDFYIWDVTNNTSVGLPGNSTSDLSSDTPIFTVVRPSVNTTYELRVVGMSGSSSISTNGSKLTVVELGGGNANGISSTGATNLSGLSDVALAGLTTGQVLTYNGTSWVNSSGASGDRLTSGTLSVTANSATSVVSLTTGGTTWGYLGGTASYLPQLTATQVSATSISSTMVQIISQTTLITCDNSHAGTLRYNSPTTALELCTGSGWQPMGVGIPAGTISAFASTTCPTGWSEYTPARGRFLRGIDNGAGNDPDGTRSPGATQADAFQGHRQHIGVNYVTGGSNIRVQEQNATSSFSDNNVALPANLQTLDFITDGTNGTPRISNETRPKNVAVTYCQFNGTSNGWNNPLSGGSTSAAGSTSYIQYNTSGSFDGNAGLTWTNASQRLTATNISATALTVNGVAITGSASGDRITSGTTTLLANNGGSLTTTASLEVSGSIAASGPVSGSTLHLQNNPPETCTTGSLGAMKVVDGRVFVCRL
ncbi:hypothetical protein SAMN05421890_4916 [Ensifer adhaerens]|nr:hypothetical protein SAMN05421890_4916 [Ensifer adhaerens]